MSAFPPQRAARLGLVVLCLCLAAACGPARRDPVIHLPPPTDSVEERDPEHAGHDATSAGVYHIVAPGQTLWRIAHVYEIGLEELRRANGNLDPSLLRVGQALFVPGAAAVLFVPPAPAPLPDGPRTLPSPGAPSTAIPPADAFAIDWPVRGGRVVSYYGAPRGARRHKGLDIKGRPGQEVLAAADGLVVYSGSGMRGYGKTIIIDHGQGRETLYAHNTRLLVAVGEVVHRGQPIARIGKTGNATTEHLHFELRQRERQVDPMPFVAGGVR